MKFKNVDKKKLVVVFLSVIIMGMCLAFLNKAVLGTDPCGIFNLGLAGQLGISLGTCQAITNSIMFIFVWIYAKDKIGWGTIANMFVVGYSFDICSWLIDSFIPGEFFLPGLNRALILVPALAIFVLAAALYISSDLGMGSYDALPFIIHSKIGKGSFRVVRICWDMLMIIMGWILGSRAGIATVIMAFALGPTISWMQNNVIAKFWKE